MSKAMKISVHPQQEKYLSSKQNIEEACTNENVLAFDIYSEDLLVGFVMVRKFDESAFFLWDYAIDYKYQNQNCGTIVLLEFISFMKDTYHMSNLLKRISLMNMIVTKGI